MHVFGYKDNVQEDSLSIEYSNMIFEYFCGHMGSIAFVA